MKLVIEFMNGDVRTVEVHGSDFIIASGKILLMPVIKIADNEIYATSSVVKITKGE